MLARPQWYFAIALFCALGLTPSAFQAATKKKKRTPARAAPKVTAAARAASLERVAQYLEGSAQSPMERPGGLVPLFERLYRLSSGQTRMPVHIIHFGDSHTAADEWTGGLRD